MYRKNHTLALAIFAICMGSFVHATDPDQPESMIYDNSSGRYFVSNFGSGEILLSDVDGNATTYFSEGIDSPAGLFIKGDTLFVANPTTIACISLSADTLITSIPIVGSSRLNDITSDFNGSLYITDSDLGYIYRLDLTTGYYGIFSDEIVFPNGIIFESVQNRILFCSSTTNYIYQLNLTDSTCTSLAKPPATGCDGLAEDNCGNIYVSCWSDGAIYAFPNSFDRPATNVIGGFSGPADISIDTVNNLLMIPQMSGNGITFSPLQPGCELVSLVSPADGSANMDTDITFEWNPVDGAVNYELMCSVWQSFKFGNITVESGTTSADVHELLPDTTYYWRVRTTEGPSKNIYGEVFSFSTKDDPTALSDLESNRPSILIIDGELKLSGLVENAACTVKIYNLAGQELMSYEYTVNESINLYSLLRGVYFISILLPGEGRYFVEKVVF